MKTAQSSKVFHFFCLLAACYAAFAQEGTSHSQLIRQWGQESLSRGQEIYETLCITCHGLPDREGTLPSSRAFWKEPFKNGNDPYSIYRTLENGLGQMPAWTFLTPLQRYDAIHYIREEFLRPLNPTAYFKITPEYLAGLPRLENIQTQIPEKRVPQYLRMDFGPALFWTLQAASNNIAYKGIAVRLDKTSAFAPGAQGRAWVLYDHDTMRVGAGWTGDEFIDWRGIAFDGSHGTHASLVGNIDFVNPPGPGWANPETGSFEDPRIRGRDNKPYGPLPRDWTHFKGVYLFKNKTILSYSVGDAQILELPSFEDGHFFRTFNITKSTNDLVMRIGPDNRTLRLIPSLAPTNFRMRVGSTERFPAVDLRAFTQGGPPRWNPPIATRGKLGAEAGPFAVDELSAPDDAANPWHTWMRFAGFDFFPDGDRAAICTWNGDVWLVTGIDGDLKQLTWNRIASGLFQPLGLKIVDQKIYVTCRDQIARLHDLNGDDEIDFIENFNSDHQVTEHFHEFAMGLETDAAGNFYYTKAARHALTAIVPQHGTLLRVSRDGSRTDILATGFRAPNGVCVNDDGTFFVTDQEGHWTPKNRINWVHAGGFYGNMFGYHDRASSADSDMEQPLVWITNEIDRSPGEIVRVTSAKWGPLASSLLNLSYGTGRIFVVSHETVGGQMQGGVVQLPIPDFPTGVMRGRFHPKNGALYACGMYAWAGNKQADGGFFRIRPTGKAAWIPIGLHARPNQIEVQFSDPLDPASASDPRNYAVKVWSLKRSADYGSKHYDEQRLAVKSAGVSDDGKRVSLEIPDLRPTWCMEIKMELRGSDGTAFQRTVHNTIHRLK